MARNKPTATQAKGNCHATTADTAAPTRAAHASRRNLREGANRAWGLLMLKDYHCSKWGSQSWWLRGGELLTSVAQS